MRLIPPTRPSLDWAEGYELLIGVGIHQTPLRELLVEHALQSEWMAGPLITEIWQRNQNAELELKARSLERLADALRDLKRPVPDAGTPKTLMEFLLEDQDRRSADRG